MGRVPALFVFSFDGAGGTFARRQPLTARIPEANPHTLFHRESARAKGRVIRQSEFLQENDDRRAPPPIANPSAPSGRSSKHPPASPLHPRNSRSTPQRMRVRRKPSRVLPGRSLAGPKVDALGTTSSNRGLVKHGSAAGRCCLKQIAEVSAPRNEMRSSRAISIVPAQSIQPWRRLQASAGSRSVPQSDRSLRWDESLSPASKRLPKQQARPRSHVRCLLAAALPRPR